ncbi:MAG: hypothetical protein WAO98_02890 [Alphaproteobacteria bacterium]
MARTTQPMKENKQKLNAKNRGHATSEKNMDPSDHGKIKAAAHKKTQTSGISHEHVIH